MNTYPVSQRTCFNEKMCLFISLLNISKVLEIILTSHRYLCSTTICFFLDVCCFLIRTGMDVYSTYVRSKTKKLHWAFLKVSWIPPMSQALDTVPRKLHPVVLAAAAGATITT